MQSSAPATPGPVRNRRWLGSVVALLVLAGCTEIALRLLDLPAPADPLTMIALDERERAAVVADRDGTWRLRPEHGGNALGLPGFAPDPRKTDRHFRIAVVGGSVAAALDVDADDAFPQHLLRLAQAEAPGARVEVLCLAVPGQSTVQQLALWRRLGRAFAPDLVFLHCGALADHAPAARTDATIARELAEPSRWRLWRLVRGLRPAPTVAAGADNVPRVPLDEFVANVRAMLAEASAAGAAVCVVVPALGGEAERAHPAAADYHAALRTAAHDAHAVLVDADRLVTAFEEAILAPPCPEHGAGHGLRDGVHLTTAAHALLAEGLLAQVRAHPRFVALSAQPTAAAARVARVEPAEVEAAQAQEVTLHGEGFPGAPGLRLWIGGRSTAVTVVDDRRLTARVPRACPPGRHALALGTAHGLAAVDPGATLEVLPAPLDAELRAGDGGGVEVTLTGTASPGARVQVFAAPAGRANAIDTPAGPWWLVGGDQTGRGARAPFCFAALPWPSFHATADASGAWRTSGAFTPDPADTNAVLQGVAWLPDGRGRGVTTQVVVRLLPR
ncbi:MAG TPA: GDSL-type esterase/lipase family protein [Planctomycetota bacterium]|nr:GDSL-type esterase/lipase family protein [Planctomycetota bacterium]